MSTLAIVLIVAAACVCCALCAYGIATAVRRHRERRDRVMHVVSFHWGTSQQGRQLGERARRHAGPLSHREPAPHGEPEVDAEVS